MPLECGVIQSVRYDENDVVLEIQFEPSMQIRRFSYPHQGRTFEAQRRICIREDLNIDRGDFDYLKQAD